MTMKKLFLSLAVISSSVFAWTQRPPQDIRACAVHAPYGMPAAIGTQPICRQAYLVGYDAHAKIPRFVTYELIPRNALGCVARTNAFATDQSVLNGATPDDYAGTGYDKGHMSPDGDLSWDPQVEFESFLMTNIAPQTGSLNRGIWKLLETSIRGWAVQHNNSFTVYDGCHIQCTRPENWQRRSCATCILQDCYQQSDQRDRRLAVPTCGTLPKSGQ